MFNKKENRGWSAALAIVTQLGLTMAGCILFCFWVGRYLDGLFKTKGLFLILFTVLGVIGGGNVVYRQIMKLFEKDQNEK